LAKFEDIYKGVSRVLTKTFQSTERETLRARNKLVQDTVAIFKTDKRNIFRPPVDLEYSKGKSSTFNKSERVYAVRELVKELEEEEELKRIMIS